MNLATDDRLVGIADVERLTGRERSTIARQVRAGRFPAPLGYLGTRRAWRLSDVEGWIAAQLARPTSSIACNLPNREIGGNP